MIYELRIDECVPGRLPDLNKRFSTITLKIWERHGIKQAGFWTTLIGESNMTLYYMLVWEFAGRARDKVGRLHGRPRVALRAGKDRGKWPDRRKGHKLYPRADPVFFGKVAPASTCTRPPSALAK